MKARRQSFVQKIKKSTSLKKNRKTFIFLFWIFVLVSAALGLFFFMQKKEMAKKEGNSLRMAIITDIDHCPSREPASLERLQSFLDQAKARKSDIIVSLGDNASHRLRDCSDTADQDVRRIADFLRSANIPAYFVLGDHDIESKTESYQAWLQTSQQSTTYYSFDTKGVHVVVLDTVLGGEPFSPECAEREDCTLLLKRQKDLKTLSFSRYRSLYPKSAPTVTKEKLTLNTELQKLEEEIAETHSWVNRDLGRISVKELQWLKNDLERSTRERVLVLSDHPLFHFVGPKKEYDIVNGEKVREILEKSGKRVVAISGEAHVWYEEKINGVQYYIVNEFRQNNGSWSLFDWDEDNFSFKKIEHPAL